MRVARYFGRSFGEVALQPYAHTLASYIGLREAEQIKDLHDEVVEINRAYQLARAIQTAMGEKDVLKSERDSLMSYLRSRPDGSFEPLTDEQYRTLALILQSIQRDNEAKGVTSYKAEDRLKGYETYRRKPRGGAA